MGIFVSLLFQNSKQPNENRLSSQIKVHSTSCSLSLLPILKQPLHISVAFSGHDYNLLLVRRFVCDLRTLDPSFRVFGRVLRDHAITTNPSTSFPTSNCEKYQQFFEITSKLNARNFKFLSGCIDTIFFLSVSICTKKSPKFIMFLNVLK